MPYQEIGGRSVGYQTWTRPSDWSTLPTVSPGDQKIVLLVQIGPNDPGKLSFTIAGAYTVDWGDGSATANFATGVQASHTYDYTTLSSGTVTSEGLRQAIAIITPQAANSLTSVNFNVTPTGASTSYVQPFREVVMAGTSINNLILGGANSRNQVRWFTYVGTSAITSLSQSFSNSSCSALRGITGTQWTALVTNFTSAFSTCVNLETMPLIDTSSATTTNNMFLNCSRLRSVPLFSTGNVTDFSSMFNGCVSLGSVPLIDTSKGTIFTGMLQSCVSLTTVPLFVTTAGTNFQNMFNGCSSLASVPAIDVGNGTTFSNMFASCVSLTTFAAALNTIKGTDFTNMFASCSSLGTHPTLDCSNGILFTGMFTGCTSLTAISINSPKGTTFTSIAGSCPSLRTVSIDMTLATVVSTLWSTPPSSISSIVLTGLRFAPASLASAQLSAAAMNALYTSLGTASGAQTLIVSTNPGSGSSTTSIATTKGWTVTGG